MSLPSINLLHLTEFKIPDKILKLMVTTTSSKVKSRSHHDVAHLQPLSNVSTKVSISYTLWFLRYSLDKTFKLKVTMARSNQENTMMMHTYTPNQCLYQVSSSYTLRFLGYSPDQNFTDTRPPTQPLRGVG